MPEYLIRFEVNPSKQLDDPKALYEGTKAVFEGSEELIKAGIIKHIWGTDFGKGLIITVHLIAQDTVVFQYDSGGIRDDGRCE